ncbi:S-layer homology domain-containing protein [Paenibacillus oryzae]|nr:S-layer homology domain-containing protein [Paenibacillus oryzae]
MKRIRGRFGLLAAAAVMACGLFAPRAWAGQKVPFVDIGSSYAQASIIHLYQQKIMTGTSLTAFSPDKLMTRAQLLTSLNRMLKLEPLFSPISPFSDVPRDAWYYGWVQASVQLELAKGTSSTRFSPEKAVTRQEAAVLLVNALKQNDSDANANASTIFGDGQDIAEWAKPGVAAAYELGLIKGDGAGNFRPADSITRQEAAVLLDRVLQNEAWAAELDRSREERIVMGWNYGQTTAQFQANLGQSNVNTLSPRWYFADGDGAIADQTDSSLTLWAKGNDKKVWAMVGNRADQDATHEMLSNAASRERAVEALTALAVKYRLDGLNLDFENVAPQDRTVLTTFVASLARGLHDNGMVLSVDVSPDRDTDWTEAFDYAALGRQADYIVLMGYDEHYSGSPIPGPNASLPYVQKAVNRLLQAVSADKIILALPFYNREWTPEQPGALRSSRFISLQEQNELVIRHSAKPVWDAELGQYMVSYMDGSVMRKLWLEEGRSLSAKYRLAIDKGLAGVAYWYIGGESPDIWASLRNTETYAQYSFSS